VSNESVEPCDIFMEKFAIYMCITGGYASCVLIELWKGWLLLFQSVGARRSTGCLRREGKVQRADRRSAVSTIAFVKCHFMAPPQAPTASIEESEYKLIYALAPVRRGYRELNFLRTLHNLWFAIF
jgi:hypothetical protein